MREAKDLEEWWLSALRIGVSMREFVREDSVAEGMRRRDRCVVLCPGADISVLVHEDTEWHDVLSAILRTERTTAEGLDGSAAWTDREMPRLMKGLSGHSWRTGRLLIDLGRIQYRQEGDAEEGEGSPLARAPVALDGTNKVAC